VGPALGRSSALPPLCAGPAAATPASIGCLENVCEAKHFSNLTHRQVSILAWRSPGLPGETLLAVDDCSRTAPPSYSGVAGLPRNGWLASAGITGWLASECPAGIRRNTHLTAGQWRGGHLPPLFSMVGRDLLPRRLAPAEGAAPRRKEGAA